MGLASGLPADVSLPATLTFRDASSRDVYTAIAQMADVNIVFDPQFRAEPVTIGLRNATLEEALASLSTATRNFYQVSAQRTITVIPDTPAKQTEYQEEIVRTFYLSNADVGETLDLLRIVIDNRRLAPITAINALSIKDTPERVAAAARLITAIDKARPEVVIDVELLEFDRTRLREYGLKIASPGSPGIDGAADVNRSDLTLSDLADLASSDIFMTNLPGLFYRLLKTDNNTRTLARRTQESDIVLTLTPRIVRVLDLSEDDLRPFRVGRAGTATTGLLDLPILEELVPAAQPAAPGSALPIQPPQPAAPAQPTQP